MSIKAMTWIWEHASERSTHLLMLLAIADHCNDDGVCYPSVRRLAEKCRIATRRAQQVIEALKANGELGVIIGVGIDTNGGKTNRYFLNRYRGSIGLAPVRCTEVDDTPPAEPCRKGDAEPCTTPGAIDCREGGANACTRPPAESCTPLPATDCTLTVSDNRQVNRHPNTPAPPPIDATECVRDEEAWLIEDAWHWASQHPFWSTRITQRDALVRHLGEGRAFRAQFLAARATLGRLIPQRHAPDPPVHPSDDDYHSVFWKRLGGAVHGTVLDPDDRH